jgi:hypothetical protein
LTPFFRSDEAQILPSRVTAVIKTCDVCGKNDAGTANCCSSGGSWEGKCGQNAGHEHTSSEGFEVCNFHPPERRNYEGIECKQNSDCHNSSLPDCVIQADGNYSQCISCSDDDFAYACQFWHGDFLTAAQVTCKKDCAELSKTTTADDLECKQNSDCHNSSLPDCVVQADESYSQCISCSDDEFAHACEVWLDDFLIAAEKTCKKDCAALSKTTTADLDCTSDNDCHEPNPSCAIQADKEFAQCITCDKLQFRYDCQVWKKGIVKAAEEKCHMECVPFEPPSPPSPPWFAPGLDCYKDAHCANDPIRNKCVVRESHAYALCISCNTTYFQDDCPYWEETDFLPLAEKKCNHKCDCPRPQKKKQLC